MSSLGAGHKTMVGLYQSKYGEVEAIQFKRTVWREIREFTRQKVHSLIVEGCKNEPATCSFRGNCGDKTGILEGAWFVKNKDVFMIIEAKEFMTEFQKIDG